jgi:hypothetical protein
MRTIGIAMTIVFLSSAAHAQRITRLTIAEKAYQRALDDADKEVEAAKKRAEAKKTAARKKLIAAYQSEIASAAKRGKTETITALSEKIKSLQNGGEKLVGEPDNTIPTMSVAMANRVIRMIVQGIMSEQAWEGIDGKKYDADGSSLLHTSIRCEFRDRYLVIPHPKDKYLFANGSPATAVTYSGSPMPKAGEKQLNKRIPIGSLCWSVGGNVPSNYVAIAKGQGRAIPDIQRQ